MYNAFLYLRNVANLPKKSNDETGRTGETGTAAESGRSKSGGRTRETGVSKESGEARTGGTKGSGEPGRNRTSKDTSNSRGANNTAPVNNSKPVASRAKSLTKKDKWLFTDVPKIRRELSDADDQWKKNDGYERTKSEFYRMELDKMDEYALGTQPRMKETYFAYLQNTPGSRKAVRECVKAMEKDSSGTASPKANDQNDSSGRAKAPTHSSHKS